MFFSDLAGWSSIQTLKTPPASAASDVIFIAFGDMGKAPRDHSDGHYIQVKPRSSLLGKNCCKF
jgi:hypothetical protein